MAIINKKYLVALIGFSSIIAAVVINASLSANQERMPAPKVAPQYPVVSVTEVTPITHQASVVAYGEVTSRNQLELTSQVVGKIIYLSPKFLTGKTFARGELIASIEPIAYQQALADAEATLADAELALAQEELSSSQAADEWQQSGLAGEKASDLVLRKPQLIVAKANYVLASKAVAQAKYNLAQTQLVAPFDALVVSKQVQIGSNVQIGSTLAELYDVSLFEVSLPLSSQEWLLLPKVGNSAEQLASLKIKLFDDEIQGQWQAKVNRSEQHINAESRQRALIAVVENPLVLANPLFPGTFVKAIIKGQEIKQLWKLPASALIDSNTVWQVNEKNLLVHLAINVMFSEGNFVYLQPTKALQQAKIVNRPLSSYLANMKVTANVEELL